ncbi:type II toxin-antitoxin system RatA family toxin [Roseococcus sp. SDR]|uniref:type II toxin-antitoxin system RatA family toxin n=1 Tax=Roseococcus sp. SDR TaxID=2835532 RepID=UPI001BD17B43|nr:type II toxin-antitoxin system RatA family toxin [Roseococcus sp. SDR]MBS7788355.1 type II toxin-antitoxin system RatA family toxin [Roseococcus sp. SDR]MBV1843669.1 type II toxin-antitoxin system RatA family toxin [Roseococcus sp. SDR]
MPTHAEKRILRQSPDQIFQIVADVHRYPEFLPWCAAARVLSRDETQLVADLTIGFKMFRETFRSEVTLDRPGLVQVKYLDGPFRYLNNTWRLSPVPQGTEVDFFVDFEFRSRVLQAVIGTVFNEAVRVMVRAFERRAMAMHGRVPAAGAVRPA